MLNMGLARVPIATVLFLGSIFLIVRLSPMLDQVMGSVLAVIGIFVLGCSIMLFSNLDVINIK